MPFPGKYLHQPKADCYQQMLLAHYNLHAHPYLQLLQIYLPLLVRSLYFLPFEELQMPTGAQTILQD